MVRLRPELYFEKMEREVQSKFDEVWAILERTALRGEQAEARFNRRMDRAEKRMDRAEKRVEIAERQIQATRRLVEGGMKIVLRNSADIKALGKRMDAYLRSARNGHNGGNGHGPKRSR
jgi:histidinol dehydrogenase